MTSQSPVEELKTQTKNNEGPYELTKGYEIDFEGDSKYHVKIGLSKLKKLKITVTELSKYNNIYEAKFDHEELISIDKFFGLYDKIEDIVREMDNLFTKNCISISMDMAHSVIFEIQISINNKARLIRLKLTKRGNEQTEALNNLCNLVSQQTKKLDLLQKENLILKEKVGKLNEKLENLKNNPEILASGQYTYALDAKSGSVLRFSASGNGLALDNNFTCNPGVYPDLNDKNYPLSVTGNADVNVEIFSSPEKARPVPTILRGSSLTFFALPVLRSCSIPVKPCFRY